MSMSIAIPAMVNNTVLSSPANASTERPPTDSQDNQNETSKEFKAVDYSSDLSLPIKAMIKSLPLWSILVSYFSEFWLFNIFVAYIPTYINSVLQVNLRDSGILSALPFLVGSICMILGGLLADFLLSRKILRLVTIRKLFTAMGKDRGGYTGGGKFRSASCSLVCPSAPGVIFPSVLCVSLPWVSSSHITTMAFLVLFTAFSSLSEAGSFVNILDIAPR
uniref:Solute carrier family 17 member 4 n=1 Tax=Equus asinus TaxID=9793 RepID=A0A8C4LG55_EQUAS